MGNLLENRTCSITSPLIWSWTTNPNQNHIFWIIRCNNSSKGSICPSFSSTVPSSKGDLRGSRLCSKFCTFNIGFFTISRICRYNIMKSWLKFFCRLLFKDFYKIISLSIDIIWILFINNILNNRRLTIISTITSAAYADANWILVIETHWPNALLKNCVI